MFHDKGHNKIRLGGSCDLLKKIRDVDPEETGGGWRYIERIETIEY